MNAQHHLNKVLFLYVIKFYTKVKTHLCCVAIKTNELSTIMANLQIKNEIRPIYVGYFGDIFLLEKSYFTLIILYVPSSLITLQ